MSKESEEFIKKKLKIYSPLFDIGEIKYQRNDTGCLVYDIVAISNSAEPITLNWYGVTIYPMVLGRTVAYYRLFIPSSKFKEDEL